MHRYLVALLGSLTIALVLAVLGVLLPMTSAGTLLLRVTPTPRAFAYLPYVAKQYPPAPTETPTPTATPTSTPTPVATIVFQDDFENDLIITPGNPEHWNNLARQGAKVETISDPTGFNRGKVLKGYIFGEALLDQGEYKRRGYPDWFNGPYSSATNIPAPCGISVYVWVPSQLEPGFPKPSANLHSIGVNDRQTGEPTYGAGLILLGRGSPLALMDSQGGWITCLLPFPYESWVNLTLEVDTNGRVLVYQDGQLDIDPNNTLRLPANGNIGIIGGHAGLYTSKGTDPNGPDYPQGTYVLNDDYKVVRWGVPTETPTPTPTGTPTLTPTPTPTPT